MYVHQVVTYFMRSLFITSLIILCIYIIYKTMKDICVSRAFPQQYGCRASKKHVHHVLYFMCHLESKPLAHNDVPGSAKLLVHRVLDHLCSRLRQTEDQTCVSVTIYYILKLQFSLSVCTPHFFRHDRRTTTKFGTHIRVDTGLILS